MFFGPILVEIFYIKMKTLHWKMAIFQNFPAKIGDEKSFEKGNIETITKSFALEIAHWGLVLVKKT